MRQWWKPAAWVFVVCAIVSGPRAAEAITLVKDGKPAAVIVVSKAALESKPWTPAPGAAPAAAKTRLAADELQAYVEMITGAKLTIVDDTQAVSGPAVYVGASAGADAAKLNIPSNITSERREEGYIIHCKGDVLVLAGNGEGPYLGTLYAVAEFLNRVGVRWYMPGEFGEIVPKKPTLEFADVTFRDKPDFYVRSWWGNVAPELRGPEAMWKVRNKMTIGSDDIIGMPGDSYLRKYLPDKKFLETNPEYFGKNFDGSIDKTMVNLTHPDVPKIVADNVKAEIKAAREKGKALHSLGFAPDDGIPMDHSKETMKTNAGFTEMVGREGAPFELSISEEWFRFMNKVTEEVVKEYPDFIVTTNGYANRNMPPEGVKLHPNMGVMYAAIWCDNLHAYDDPKSWQNVLQGQMLKRWCELNNRVFLYNYGYTMIVNCLTPVPTTRKLARNFPLMKKWGVYGFADEHHLSYMAHGIPEYYIRAKLMWNANLDVKKTLDEFFEHWYGPASKHGAAYWDALEEAMESTPMQGHEDRILPYVYDDALVKKLEASVSAAEAAAKEEPYKTRVKLDRLILEHLKGYMAMNDAEFQGKYAEALKHADGMMKARVEINKINASFHYLESRDPHTRYFSGAFYWNMLDRIDFYKKCLDYTTGKTGDLIVMAPTKTKFALDDADLGRYGRWYDASYDRSKWKTIDTTKPFYIQGYMDDAGIPYRGFMWYVFEVDVPANAVGKPIELYAPIVCDEAWVWVNGEYIGHRPYAESYIRPAEVKLDASKVVKAGKNTIGVRVHTSSNRTQVAEGFQGPLMLVSPKPVPKDEKKADGK